MSTLVRKALLGCGIASSALYVAGDLLGALRYPGYRLADQQISELLAEGSPVRPFMAAVNGIPYALLVGAFAAGVWTAAGPRRAGRVTGAALGAYATASLAGALLFPMKTREALAAGEATWRTAGHLPATAAITVCLLSAMGVGATLLGRRFRWYSYGTIATLLVAGGLVGVQTGRIGVNQPTPGMGLTERVNIYATMLWLAVLAIGLLRAQGSRALPQLGQPTLIPQGASR